MNLAISNIAWSAEEDNTVYKLLLDYNVRGLEIAPARIFPDDVYDAPLVKINSFKAMLKDFNLQVVAMQSILFGIDNVELFASTEKRKNLEIAMKKAIDFAQNIGAKNIVYGAPKTRIKGELTKQEADDIALDFFTEIANHAHAAGVYMLLEANPKAYGGDWICNTFEAIDFIKKLNKSNFALNFDLSTMSMNNESYQEVFPAAIEFAKHFHISESMLGVVPENGSEDNHAITARLLNEYSYKNWISIEMKKISNIDNLDNIRKSLDFVKNTYN